MTPQLLSQGLTTDRSGEPKSRVASPTPAPKIAITGVTGLRNRGVEALVVATIDRLRAQWPGVQITVLTRSPEYDSLRLGGRSVNVIDNTLHNPQSWQKRLMRTVRSVFRHGRMPCDAAQRALRDASLVIALGGDVFSSDYASAPAHLRPLEFALGHGVPVAMLGHSIGPFKTSAETSQWLDVARRCALITVRESLSYDYLLRDLKLPAQLVSLTADPAVLLEPADADRTESLLAAYGISPGTALATVAPSQGILEYTGIDRERHFDAWTKVIRTLNDRCGAEVLIVPHVQETYVANDDRIIAAEIHRRLEFDRRVRVAGADHSAGEFKGLIAAGDLIVAERMHAAIAAISSGKPALLVGYSVKSRGIVKDLFTDSDLAGAALISIQDFLDPAKAVAAVQGAWAKRNATTAALAERLPALHADAEKNFSLLAGCLTAK